MKELIKYKRTLGFTVISGFIVGSFLVYLSTAQQIFQEQYDLKEEFPLIFAGLAIAIGTSTFLNGTLVLRFGMEKMVTTFLLFYFGISLLYLFLFVNAGNPPVEILLLFFGLQFFAIGFLFGNLRALAMEPIGHIAGIGAAITGFISTLMSVPISTFIGRYVHDTALPIFIGFSICSLLSIGILYYLKVNVKEEVVRSG
jgi:DHA1 family bicyclomycin/chloramphenicol resistance-like MFS transporter